MTSKYITVSVRLSWEQFQELERRATEREQTKSQYIRAMLTEERSK